jgi:hypothetical protein
MINISGRDESIISKALLYAIVAIQRMPAEQREQNDCERMRALLESRLGAHNVDPLLSIARQRIAAGRGRPAAVRPINRRGAH